MKERLLACVLALALLLGTTCVAMGESTYSARTRIYDDDKRQNIALAAKAIDDTELEYGEEFSFNDIVGARTRARGYVSAENGRGVRVTGGGVAQAAATLYMTLLKLDDNIEFTELSTYGSKFTDDYVSSGDLAVITDYSAGTDFKFINRAGKMRVSMWLSGYDLYCSVSVESGGGWFDGDDGPEMASVRIDLFGIDSGTLKNIRLAAGSVNDTTLARNDRFSFNRIVGPRTAAYGYASGMNGRGIRVTGGGVAQVASAIWLAIKDRDDVAVIEKSTYGERYNQDYVDSSSDAIVTDYSAGTDFSFRYTGAGTMTVYTYIDGDALICEIAVND